MEPAKEENKESGVKILGGFFVFRSNPIESKPISETLTETGDSIGKEFLQKGQIVGMVLIKQYGIRTYMGYSPIDPETKKMDSFMTYFSDTAADNAYDNNRTQVFDIDTLPYLINKMIIQPLESADESADKPADE